MSRPTSRVLLVLLAVSRTFASEATPEILIGQDAAEPVRFAAQEMARYLGRASGASIEVATDSALTGHAAMWLGIGPGVPYPYRLEPKSPGEDAYRMVSTKGGGWMLRGRSPRAVLFAVYDFLEEEVGYRWYFPYPEDALMPEPDPDLLAALRGRAEDREESPEFSFREREFRDVLPMTEATDARIVQQIDWWAKLRMSCFLLNFGYARDAELWRRWKGTLIPEIKRRGMRVGLGEHGSYPLFLSPGKYAEAHPEWYCEIDGERVPGMTMSSGEGAQFCTSHPEAVATYLENFAAFVRENPDVDFYYPAPNDVSRWCECEACRRLSVADRYLRLDNRVAEMLERIRPGTRVMHLAYSNHRLPPDETLPHPMLDIDIACWGRDFAYSLCDARTMPESPEHLDAFRRWTELCRAVRGPTRPRVLYHSKLMRHYWLGLHLGPLPVLDRDFDCVRKLGLDGFDFPLGFLGIRTKALNAYVVARKCWDPDRPAGPLVTRFLSDVYGDRAPVARRIHRLVDEAFADLRYGSSLTLAWHPERIAVRDQPLEGLAESARGAISTLGQAIALAESSARGDGAIAGRFRRLGVVLRRARDEQEVLLGLDALARCHQGMEAAKTRVERERRRKLALDAWRNTKEASDQLAERYRVEEDLAGLYWASASHEATERALDDWLEELEELSWSPIGSWRTEDFADSSSSITRSFDVTDRLAGLPACQVQVKFEYLRGELGVSTRSVSLWLRPAHGEGAERRIAVDAHGGFAGWVHENATYRLEIPGSPSPGEARLVVKVELAACGATGAIASRGSHGRMLLGVPGSGD